MADGTGVAVRLSSVVVDYRGLRPLRIRSLDIAEGQCVALVGLDRPAASVMVDLITGATLPDSGDVTVFGESTRAITDGQVWLRALERFGLLGERTVLVDQLTAEQNLAIPVTLAVHDLAPEIRERVRRVAREVGLPSGALERPAEGLSPLDRFRLQLGRALMLEPRLLLAEHPTATLAETDVAQAAADLSRIVGQRRVTAVLLTMDHGLASQVATRVLTLRPGTGELAPAPAWRRWFS